MSASIRSSVLHSTQVVTGLHGAGHFAQVNQLIAICHSAEAVSSHNHSELAGKTAQRLKQLCFRRDVECAGCFVQNQQRWTVIKCTRKTDPLTLPARKADTALANVRLKTIVQFRFNEVEYLRHST